MNDLGFYINQLNNREMAIALWLVVLLIWSLSKSRVRSTMFAALRTLLLTRLVILLTAMLVYVGLTVLFFSELSLWDASLTKDTVFWTIGTAFVFLFNVNEATQNERFFRKILLDSLKVVLVLEFIVNLYSFRLWVELLVVPILFIVGAMSGVASTDENYRPVKRLADIILTVFGLSAVIFTASNIVSDFQGFASSDNLQAFLLPPLLTLAYLPFLYFAALLITYESLFLRVDILLKKDKALARFTKRRILAACHADLGKLGSFSREYTKELLKLNDRTDVLDLIASFNRNRSPSTG